MKGDNRGKTQTTTAGWIVDRPADEDRTGCASNHRESTLPPSWPSQPFAPQGGEPQLSESGSPSPPPCRVVAERGAASQTCEVGSEESL